MFKKIWQYSYKPLILDLLIKKIALFLLNYFYKLLKIMKKANYIKRININ